MPFTKKHPKVARKQSKCCKPYTREEKAMLAPSKPPCQLSDHLWQGKQVTPRASGMIISQCQTVPTGLCTSDTASTTRGSTSTYRWEEKTWRKLISILLSAFIELCLPLLPLIFETSIFSRKRTIHKEPYSPWSTSGHRSLPLTSSLLHQIPFAAEFPSEMLMVEGLGFCFWPHAATSSKAQGIEVLEKQAVYLKLFTT